MSALDFWSAAAIAVLVAGSLAIFVWFLRDLLRLHRELAGPATGARAAATAAAANRSEARDLGDDPGRRRDRDTPSGDAASASPGPPAAPPDGEDV